MTTAFAAAALLAASAHTQPAYTEDFQSFSVAPINLQQGWTSNAEDDARITEDESLNRAAVYQLQFQENFDDERAEWGIVGAPLPAAYGRLELDVTITPGLDDDDQHHIATEDPITGFLNVRLALYANGDLAVFTPVFGSQDDIVSTFAPGEVVRIAIEITPSGVVRVFQNNALIYESAEFAEAYLGFGRAGKIGRVSAWSRTKSPNSEDETASSITIDNITFTPTACPADFNADGAVDALDLSQVLARWKDTRPSGPADLNADGAIDSFDLTALLAYWGDCP